MSVFSFFSFIDTLLFFFPCSFYFFFLNRSFSCADVIILDVITSDPCTTLKLLPLYSHSILFIAFQTVSKSNSVAKIAKKKKSAKIVLTVLQTYNYLSRFSLFLPNEYFALKAFVIQLRMSLELLDQ